MRDKEPIDPFAELARILERPIHQQTCRQAWRHRLELVLLHGPGAMGFIAGLAFAALALRLAGLF